MRCGKVRRRVYASLISACGQRGAANEMAKPVEFLGRSLEDLRAFPAGARREAGYQLDRVQSGLEPDDWKWMNTIGTGAREIRIRNDTGAYRVVYVASIGDTIYVLHAFQKKTRATSKRDIEVATARFRVLQRRNTS